MVSPKYLEKKTDPSDQNPFHFTPPYEKRWFFYACGPSSKNLVINLIPVLDDNLLKLIKRIALEPS